MSLYNSRFFVAAKVAVKRSLKNWYQVICVGTCIGSVVKKTIDVMYSRN
jgi:hypothetical protein